MKHPAVEAYLFEIGEALQFDRQYARDVCDEVADHLYESVDEQARAQRASPSRAGRAQGELRALFERFGQPRVLAAQFASTYVFRKLLALLAWVFALGAASYMLGLVVGPLSWAGFGLAGGCALAVLPAVLRVRREVHPRAQNWPKLCMPMLASTSAVLLLGAALVASAVWKVEHCQSSICIALDLAIALALLLRWALHRKQTARMCALWRSVS